MKRTALASVAILSFVLLAACDIERQETGPTETIPVSIDAGGADRANVELDMAAGEMRVTGGAAKLMEGNLEFNVPTLKPEIINSHNGVHTAITVRQHGSDNTFGKSHNLWDLQLSNKVLLDVTINCGAGQAKLDLGSVTLRELQVHMGAGQVDLDLTGKPTHDYEIKINGGVGQATVHLPEGVGIWASAHGGIGSINVTGLEKKGDHWENELFDCSKVTVRVEVNGGIGEVRLIG